MHTLKRFLERVRQGPDGCWLWAGGTRSNGYGTFAVKREDRWTQTTAHRIAYELFVGDIPLGFEVDHLCRVRGCVRPDHLEAVSVAENRRRRDAGYPPSVARDTRPIPPIPEPPPTPAQRPTRDPNVCRNGHDRRVVGTVSNGRGRTCAQCRADQQARRRTGGRHGTETHCPHGHPYEGDNLVVRVTSTGSRSRECRTCVRARNLAYKRRTRARRPAV